MSPEMLLYPGDEPPRVRRLSELALGASLTASEVTYGCHIGTHVDAPAHFISDGSTLDQLPLERFYGPATVLTIDDKDSITPSDLLDRALLPGRHLILKTRNSALLSTNSFHDDYCFVTEEAAKAIVAARPLSLGFDYYSLDPPSAELFPAHLTLARAGVPVFVCLDLRAVPSGEYFFYGLPLRMVGLEGGPVRAVLFPA